MEIEEYPKMLYFKGDAVTFKIVNDAAEEDALGEHWIDAPSEAATAAAAKKR